MFFVSISQADHGPPPPPPPIYADKTRGSKVVVGAELRLSFRYDPAVTPRCERQGAILWLRSSSGTWYEGVVERRAFVDDGSGYVQLSTAIVLDPSAVFIQPRHDDWAQAVDLGVHDAMMPELVAPLG